MQSPDNIERLAQRIHASFSLPFKVAGTSITLTASIGTASAGPEGPISDQLLAQADIAMYQVKDKGGAGHQTFDLSAAQLVTERLTLERDLRGALQAGSLDLAFQPIVRTADPQVFGVEALLRWTSPERGAVSPLSMVAAAEESNLITEVGDWVLERACRERSDWANDYPDAQLDMAVNISARQLMTPGFHRTVAATLQQTGMNPGALVLEITESVLLTDAERAVVVLNGLKDLGVRLALDDFGTGYSSLSYLRQLPIDIVKIDQSFIAGMDHPRGGAIVEGVTTLAHALGLTVVAEGVETLHQHERITALGCESAQGFFYARPMPAVEIADALGSDTAHPWRLPDASEQPPQSLRQLGLGA
jgi:EAL domain-containing protein (putative c-di-GMP-specific phosphodiesterase class I)